MTTVFGNTKAQRLNRPPTKSKIKPRVDLPPPFSLFRRGETGLKERERERENMIEVTTRLYSLPACNGIDLTAIIVIAKDSVLKERLIPQQGS